jgi:anaerobic magnesium-protoporphyrin IX monomethyl ester cyclase
MSPKILFINSPSNYTKRIQSLPLNLLNLGTILKQSGFEIKLIDLNAEKQYDRTFYPNVMTPTELVQQVKKFNPDIVGITSITENYPVAMTIARLCKDENENLQIMYGGIHATFQAFECLQDNPFIDLVVKGEAEHIIVDIINGFLGKHDLKEIPNIVYRSKDTIKSSQVYTLPDLDNIPPPELSLIKGKFYPSFRIPFELSRGCPFQCAFCCLSTYSDRRIRYFPSKRAIDTLQAYQEHFENFGFFISDATFMFDYKRLRAFLDQVKAQKIELNSWTMGTRVNTIKQKILKELVNFNLSGVGLGIEDIHDSVLQAINKEQTFIQIKRALKTLKKLGLPVISNFIIGLPSQTRAHMLENIAFTENLDSWTCLYLVPLPGSKIGSEPEKYGLKILSKDYGSYSGEELVMDSTVFPAQEQKEMKDLACRRIAERSLKESSTFLDDRADYERLLEIGHEAWFREWKQKYSTGWT